MKNKLLLLSMIIGTTIFTTNAQSNSYTLNSSGGSATISGNLYEWSIGEMLLVNTASTSSLIVTQGLLQTKINDEGINVKELNVSQLSVYPNPTADFLILQTDVSVDAQLDIAIYDLTGKLFQKQNFHLKSGNEAQRIDFSSYAAGMYVLEVKTTIDGKSYTNAYKIQNNK